MIRSENLSRMKWEAAEWAIMGWIVDSGGYLEYTVYDGEQSSDSKPSAPLV